MPIRRTGALAMRTSSLTLPSGTRGARQTINQATQASGPTNWAKDADPQKIMEILSFRFRAPTLANGDGEPMVRCSGRIRVAAGRHDTDTLAGDLDDHYGPPDERDGTGAVGPGILAAVTPTGHCCRWR